MSDLEPTRPSYGSNAPATNGCCKKSSWTAWRAFSPWVGWRKRRPTSDPLVKRGFWLLERRSGEQDALRRTGRLAQSKPLVPVGSTAMRLEQQRKLIKNKY